jgi:hypothetical protein
LVNFRPFWYFYQEKSGNPDREGREKFFPAFLNFASAISELAPVGCYVSNNMSTYQKKYQKNQTEKNADNVGFIHTYDP